MPKDKKKKESAFLMGLLTQREQKSSRVNEAFEHFYDKAKKKIKLRADHHESETIFTVPPYTYGLALYDNALLCTMLKRRFVSDGFYTQRLNDNVLYLNWSPAGVDKVNKRKLRRKRKDDDDRNSAEKAATDMLKSKWDMA